MTGKEKRKEEVKGDWSEEQRRGEQEKRKKRKREKRRGWNTKRIAEVSKLGLVYGIYVDPSALSRTKSIISNYPKTHLLEFSTISRLFTMRLGYIMGYLHTVH